MNKPSKALFIQLRRIGDVLMCTPAIRAFKKSFPDCRLDFLTELPEVLQYNPRLNAIIPVNRKKEYNPLYQFQLIKKIRNSHYDVVVDFFANPRSAYYSFLSNAPIRLSYGFGHRKWAYNLTPVKSNEPAYAANDRLKLLEAIEIASDGPELEFYISDAQQAIADSLITRNSKGPTISISPVSRREFNRWPLEKYADLCDFISGKLQARVVLIAGPREEAFVNRVSSLASSAPMVLQINSLGILGAIFKKIELHIGNDNGPKHIAVACGTPTLTIFGPHSPISWTFPDRSRHFWISPTEYCQDCRTGKHNCQPGCIKLIPLEAVCSKLSEMINSLKIIQSQKA